MILERYKHRGYPNSILQSALDNVRLKPRMGKAIIQKNWHILETDPRLENICHKKVVVGYKRPQNIRDILVSSRLCYPPAPYKPKGFINPTKLCKNIKCRYSAKSQSDENIVFFLLQGHNNNKI